MIVRHCTFISMCSTTVYSINIFFAKYYSYFKQIMTILQFRYGCRDHNILTFYFPALFNRMYRKKNIEDKFLRIFNRSKHTLFALYLLNTSSAYSVPPSVSNMIIRLQSAPRCPFVSSFNC